jgi:DNA-binding LytR/AlgR family response regulator
MKTIRLLLADDEPLAHKVLEGYCRKIDFIEIVGNCYDGISSLNFLNKHQVDAILLDIQMPDLTGLELLDSLKSDSPKVILTTAHTEFAVRCFEYDQVVDYLHKPIRIDRFYKSVNRLKSILELEKGGQKVQATRIPPEDIPEFFSIKDNRVLYKIRFNDVVYIQAWGNYLRIFLESGETKTVRKTIKEIARELPDQLFERIHKSYIVNRRKVSALEGNQLFLNDVVLPIGKSYAMLVKERLL